MNSKKAVSFRYGVLWMALALAGCGGGGGDSSPAQSTTQFPVQQALQYAYAHGLQQTLNVTGTASSGGSVLPVTGSLTFTLGVATATTFNGASALASASTVSGALSLNGQSLPLYSTGTDYLSTQYQPVGESSTGHYCVAASAGAYPATATAGMTGQVVTFDCYTDSTRSSKIGTQATSYVTTAGDNNTLNVQFIQNIYDTSNKLTATGSTTYAVTAAGLPTLVQFVMGMTDSGVTLSLTAQ